MHYDGTTLVDAAAVLDYEFTRDIVPLTLAAGRSGDYDTVSQDVAPFRSLESPLFEQVSGALTTLQMTVLALDRDRHRQGRRLAGG